MFRLLFLIRFSCTEALGEVKSINELKQGKMNVPYWGIQLSHEIQSALKRTYREMNANCKSFCAYLISRGKEMDRNFLVIPASKVAVYHEEIHRALDVLHNGYTRYIAWLEQQKPTIYVEKFEFSPDGRVPQIMEPWQDFRATTPISRDIIKDFMKNMRETKIIHNGALMRKQMESTLIALNRMAELLEQAAMTTSFIAEAHMAEVIHPAQIRMRDNFFDKRRTDYGLPTFRDLALVKEAEEKSKDVSQEVPPPENTRTPRLRNVKPPLRYAPIKPSSSKKNKKKKPSVIKKKTKSKK